MPQIKSFINMLQSFSSLDVFKPWRDQDLIFDVQDAPSVRSEHLEKYFT